MYINFFTFSWITIAKVRCIYILIIVENKIVMEEIDEIYIMLIINAFIF